MPALHPIHDAVTMVNMRAQTGHRVIFRTWRKRIEKNVTEMSDAPQLQTQLCKSHITLACLPSNSRQMEHDMSSGFSSQNTYCFNCAL